ncbi:MAG: AAA family ATPase, partial [Waterburya sp.]
RFLSALAQYPLTEAALMIRDGSGTADIRNLFHRVGDRYVDKMSFEAEMIIPKEAIDTLGKKVKGITNFVKYSLALGYKKSDNSRSLETLKILKEKLIGISQDGFEQHLLFKYKADNLINFGIGNESNNLYIYTGKNERQPLKSLVVLNSFDFNDKQIITSTGKLIIEIKNLTSTLLCSHMNFVGRIDSVCTQYLTREEMISWQLLQLEPSSLRQPNEFTAPSELGINGSNLASALYHLVEKYSNENTDKITEEEIEVRIYAQLSNRLSELLDNIDSVWIDRDDVRQLLTLMIKKRDGTVHSARSLSDGTLRFLALAILELDPESPRLLCLEEPENGIHPVRIVSTLELLQAIAVDLDEPIGFDNPLRQVIINTHSPVVLQQVPEDSLLIAELRETVVNGQRFKRACFSYLADTWRDNHNEENGQSNIISKGELLAYLNPVLSQPQHNRVIDRPDLQSLIPGNSPN